MLVLQSHYRSPSNFSWSNLTAAHNRLRNWRNGAELRHQISDSQDDSQDKIVNNLLEKAAVALIDDLDTPNALKYLDEAFSQFTPANVSHFALEKFINFVDNNLGFNISGTTPNITPEQQKLINLRAEARANKNWAESDKLRDQLAEQGIELNDAANQTIWSRK
jgi:cysteinyl-tRNA synthetase